MWRSNLGPKPVVGPVEAIAVESRKAWGLSVTAYQAIAELYSSATPSHQNMCFQALSENLGNIPQEMSIYSQYPRRTLGSRFW